MLYDDISILMKKNLVHVATDHTATHRNMSCDISVIRALSRLYGAAGTKQTASKESPHDYE